MKRSGYFVMGLVLAAMAGLYFLQGSEEFEEATYTIPTTQVTIDPARIVRVDIARPDGFVRLERLRGEWKVTEPVFATVDQEHMLELQRGMGDFRLIGLVSTNPRKQRVLKVDEQGTGVVLVSDDGRSLSLVVGKAAPTLGNAFVRPALSDTVYLAHGLTPAILNRELLDWRMRTVFRAPPESIHGITIATGSARHVLQKLNQGWASRTGPVPAELMHPTLEALADIKAQGFVDTALILKNRPRYEVDIAAARPVRLELYPLSPADSNYLLKTSLSSAIVVVPPALARGLDRLVASIAPPPPPPVAKTITPVPSPPVPRAATQPGATPAPVQRQPAEKPPGQGKSTSRQTEAIKRQPEESGNLTVHVVKRGESIISIARKYEVTVDQLKQWNGLRGENVVPGMEMYVFVKPPR
jgi:hypothetical protein